MKVNREQIIRQALISFAAHDYEGVSLNDIAESLNITKGGIYHYFSSKDELFREAVYFIFGQIEMSIDEAAFEGAAARDIISPFFDLKSLSAEYSKTLGVDVMADYKSVVYLMFTALKKFPETVESLRQTYAGIIKTIEVFLAAAAERGEIKRDLDFEALSFLISAYIEGGMLLGGIGVAEDDPGFNRRVFEMFWSFITEDDDKGGTK